MQRNLTVHLITPLCIKSRFLVIALLFLGGQLQGQSFQVGHMQKVFVDSTRDGREVPCEVYYPADFEGENTPLAAGTFPVLVFGHGFVMAWSAYDIYWLTLVPRGYIMVFPTTESDLSPSHADFAMDMAFLVSALQQEGNDSLSAFYNRVDTLSAVMGHSMGGGSALLSVQYNVNITAIAIVAAAETMPSSIAAAPSVLVPALVFAGSNDCVTPPEDHQLPMYNALASSCKTYVSISGGDHCQFAGYNFYCILGQSTCLPQATIDAATQQQLVFDYLLPWLNFYLKGDCLAGDAFQELMADGAGIAAQQNCALDCFSNVFTQPEVNGILELYPNPGSDRLSIKGVALQPGAQYSVFNAAGLRIDAGTILTQTGAIDVSHYAPGYYMLVLSGVAAPFVVE